MFVAHITVVAEFQFRQLKNVSLEIGIDYTDFISHNFHFYFIAFWNIFHRESFKLYNVFNYSYFSQYGIQ